ncbi:transmembrane protease serine 9-like [Schistocerca americana]|uniref:transmembrane protease serine 9-like n=1 Tax=Schistocerca americana TaxID=7009 RepID=UPI001F4F4DA4|nr:transmembrane protease serine 9-like [Schistocerca americana]
MGWLLVLLSLALPLVEGEPGEVGGCQRFVEIEDQPYVASLQKIAEGHVCTATLITTRWLLTAAQCIVVREGEPLPAADYFVLMGSSNFTNQIALKVGQRGWPDLFVVHPMFKIEMTLDYDLGLIRLQSKLVLSRRVSYVPLPDDIIPGEILYSLNCTVAGWGKIKGKSPKKARTLVKLHLRLVDTPNCSQSLQRQLRGHVHLCSFQDKILCGGDTGSALICHDVQVGVASWCMMCADRRPGVYARVDTQLAWLLQVISGAPPVLPAAALCGAWTLAAAALSWR